MNIWLLDRYLTNYFSETNVLTLLYVESTGQQANAYSLNNFRES